MIYIRQTYHLGFRSGEWAHLFSIQHNEDGKDIWIVEFPDGATDAWPSWDSEAGYDVKVQIEPPVVEESYDDQSLQTGSTARSAAANILALHTSGAQRQLQVEG